jgi:RimJ/RimL family protein N-acetyltransferase
MTFDVDLVAIDEEMLERLTEVAVADAEPGEVMPPVSGPDRWTPSHVGAFRAFHRDRRAGLCGPWREATFAVWVEGRVVGSARLASTGVSGVLEVGLWLARSARGRGIGTAVLPALVEAARHAGATTVVAETIATNQSAVAALRRNNFLLADEADSNGIHAQLALWTDRLVLRRWRPDDAASVRTLHEVALRQAGAFIEGPEGRQVDRDLDDVEDYYLGSGGEFLVGAIDGHVIAMGALLRLDEVRGQIRRMRVGLDFQRRGYGRAILRRLEERAVETKLRFLILDTSPTQVAAYALYRSEGYVEVGREERSGFQLIVMKKAL